jgi:hypothetical protein
VKSIKYLQNKLLFDQFIYVSILQHEQDALNFLAWKQTYVSPALKFAGRRRAKRRSDENVVKSLTWKDSKRSEYISTVNPRIWYSNLHPSTNRKHFRAFVYVWNKAFTVGNWNVFTAHVTCHSEKPWAIFGATVMFWCASVHVSIFPSPW